MEKTFNSFIHEIQHLRVDSKNGEAAPHKPILLLSIINGIENDWIKNNQIDLSPELIEQFKIYWSKLVENRDVRIALPFYHLRSSKFWKLIPNEGCELWVESKSAMRTISNLKTAVAYAIIDEMLFNFLLKKENRDILKIAILERYFPKFTGVLNDLDEKSHLQDITKQILEETPESYKLKIVELKRQLSEEAFREEVVVRSALFKREVPKIYNFTCCITGLKIDAAFDISMIDACHIIPFSTSYNDTIINGIPLTPTIHRAFDYGLMSIDDNYRILISKQFKESESNFSLKQFENQQIILPDNSKNFPDLKSLNWHRINKFKP
jgi:putative restriction endonuclease